MFRRCRPGRSDWATGQARRPAENSAVARCFSPPAGIGSRPSTRRGWCARADAEGNEARVATWSSTDVADLPVDPLVAGVLPIRGLSQVVVRTQNAEQSMLLTVGAGTEPHLVGRG